MRKIALCLALLAVLFTNCFKDKNDDCVPRDIVASSAEQKMVLDYLVANGINAIHHASGLYYQIAQPGVGLAPAICSSIKVGYTGKLLDGTVVERDDNMVLNLKLMLEGWRIALPLIQSGGKIRIWLPPTLAYGREGKTVNNNQIVPPNAVLYYEITLKEVM